jgi:hypothetical protein
MRFKGTLILLLVCVALGSYLYWYEIRGGEKREKAKQAESQVWKLDSKDIQQIELSSPSLHITAVKKNDKEWILTAPKQYDADSDELNRLANAASNLRREQILEQNVDDFSRFGLAPPQSSLKLKTKEGKEYAIDFGINNPSGNNAYARFPNQKSVLLVTSSAATVFNKKVEELRDHSVLNFEQPEAQTLCIKNPKGNLELVKDNTDRWWLAGADKKAADSPEVRGILNTLSMGKIREFFNDDAGNYANTGLDKPYIDVSLTYGKNKAIKHLIIGAEKSKLQKKGQKAGKPEGKASDKSADRPASEMYLAKDESRPDLFFVDKEFVEKLLKSPGALRDKALTAFQRWDLDSMELTNSKGTFTFTKSGGEWFLEPAKKKAKFDAINGILEALEKPVMEWIDKPAALSTYGLDKPLIHAVLKQGANVIADCSFGKSAKNGGIYAQIKGDSTIKIANPDGISILDKAESDFVEPPAPSVPAKK